MSTIHTRQLTTIHTRQLKQQYTQDNSNNNTYKTTQTTIHTIQLTTIYTRHLKIQHVQKVNNTKVRKCCIQFLVFFSTHIVLLVLHGHETSSLVLSEKYTLKVHINIILIIIIIYLSWSWATCWPVPVTRIQKSLPRSNMIPSASWTVVFHYPG